MKLPLTVSTVRPVSTQPTEMQGSAKPRASGAFRKTGRLAQPPAFGRLVLRSRILSQICVLVMASALFRCTDTTMDYDDASNSYTLFVLLDGENFCRGTTEYIRAEPGESFSGLTKYQCFLFQNDASLTIQMDTAPNSGEYRTWVDGYYRKDVGQDPFISFPDSYQEAWVFTACYSCQTYSVDF